MKRTKYSPLDPHSNLILDEMKEEVKYQARRKGLTLEKFENFVSIAWTLSDVGRWWFVELSCSELTVRSNVNGKFTKTVTQIHSVALAKRVGGAVRFIHNVTGKELF